MRTALVFTAVSRFSLLLPGKISSFQLFAFAVLPFAIPFAGTVRLARTVVGLRVAVRLFAFAVLPFAVLFVGTVRLARTIVGLTVSVRLSFAVSALLLTIRALLRSVFLLVL